MACPPDRPVDLTLASLFSPSKSTSLPSYDLPARAAIIAEIDLGPPALGLAQPQQELDLAAPVLGFFS